MNACGIYVSEPDFFFVPVGVMTQLALSTFTGLVMTALVAMGVDDKTGGIPALAAVFSVMTGLTGALAGK